jgi:uncharacterized protein with PIN domain
MRLKLAVHKAIEEFFLGKEGTFVYNRCPTCQSPNILLLKEKVPEKSRKKHLTAYLFCNNCGAELDGKFEIRR